ncbi:flagellar protein FliT [Peribacillus cavernae]|uniref:Flagellar protein FliT n=1 Tax=Peribacillus cavernae TaxID=1674310 RepID=A0A3S0VNA0_9BACI|nr:flagellar protein FliT [Peribacillus cavernae]MDQ0218398.1 flagellar protein FliT [Peribacillus cavernae]RUQ31403.1 flagellar protein FliT [Peribacillus cavernae]
MSPVQTFHETTVKLIDLLECKKPQERDERVRIVEKLLSQRENLLSTMQPPFSDEEKEFGRQLIELNQKVTILLNREKIDIQKDIKQLSAKKTSTAKYMNSYQALSNDGMFYDKRK